MKRLFVQVVELYSRERLYELGDLIADVLSPIEATSSVRIREIIETVNTLT